MLDATSLTSSNIHVNNADDGTQSVFGEIRKCSNVLTAVCISVSSMTHFFTSSSLFKVAIYSSQLRHSLCSPKF